MRKITKEAVAAFMDGREYHNDNTAVISFEIDGISMYLFHNEIANRRGKKLRIRTAGYPTKTTMERLNGIPGVSVYQKKFKLYLNGKLWENHETWTEVK